MSKHAYSYTILRYVHDPVADESVNVGVMLHASNSGFLKARTRTTIGRLRRLFPDLDGEAFKRILRSVEVGVERLAAETLATPLLPSIDTASLARSVLPADDSGLQWSRLGAGFSDNPAITLEKLFQRFVSRHDEAIDKRRGEDDIWRPIWQKLTANKVADRFEQKTIYGDVDEITLKHAWKNSIWHAVEPISLDLADADSVRVKARRWLGHLCSVDRLAEMAEISLIVGKPSDKDLVASYHDALNILRKAPTARIYEEDEADTVVEKLIQDIKDHDSAERVRGKHFLQGQKATYETPFSPRKTERDEIDR